MVEKIVKMMAGSTTNPSAVPASQPIAHAASA